MLRPVSSLRGLQVHTRTSQCLLGPARHGLIRVNISHSQVTLVAIWWTSPYGGAKHRRPSARGHIGARQGAASVSSNARRARVVDSHRIAQGRRQPQGRPVRSMHHCNDFLLHRCSRGRGRSSWSGACRSAQNSLPLIRALEKTLMLAIFDDHAADGCVALRTALRVQPYVILMRLVLGRVW